ncbi:MAG: hypothetical protein LBN05_02340 [Oscillospiraceae bacterium]|jgi:DNA repair exonuclease SbcCD ATPase subunit|nr:hypothetical protein [Oscillospiraceae bacterium]
MTVMDFLQTATALILVRNQLQVISFPAPMLPELPHLELSFSNLDPFEDETAKKLGLKKPDLPQPAKEIEKTDGRMTWLLSLSEYLDKDKTKNTKERYQKLKDAYAESSRQFVARFQEAYEKKSEYARRQTEEAQRRRDQALEEYNAQKAQALAKRKDRIAQVNQHLAQLKQTQNMIPSTYCRDEAILWLYEFFSTSSDFSLSYALERLDAAEIKGLLRQIGYNTARQTEVLAAAMQGIRSSINALSGDMHAMSRSLGEDLTAIRQHTGDALKDSQNFLFRNTDYSGKLKLD